MVVFRRGELQRFAPIRLDAIASAYRQSGSDYLAVHAKPGQPPVDDVPGRSGLVADAQFLRLAQPSDEPAHRRLLIGDRSQRAHLTAGLCDGDGDALGMDIQPDEADISHDRPPSLVALRYGPIRGVTYAPRTGAGRSILTTADRRSRGSRDALRRSSVRPRRHARRAPIAAGRPRTPRADSTRPRHR